ncbi:hypothetical protein [Enterococcus sp. DIV0800]|uniref:hypothetical protein n=1 Tax=unclassified Enterococcus TaxID=2608891 RepID=UPI003D2FFE0B
MKRDQHNNQKRNAILNKLLILVGVIIIGLVAFILGMQFVQPTAIPASSHSIPTTTRSSTSSQASTATSTTTKLSSSTEPSATLEETGAYAVDFPKGDVLMGEDVSFKFAVTTYLANDSLIVSYTPKESHSQDAHNGESATLYPTTIPTTRISVVENGLTKDVKINTELKLPASDSSKPNLAFFQPFNGDDTRIYSYLNRGGNIVLAFSPSDEHGPYSTVVLQ